MRERYRWSYGDGQFWYNQYAFCYFHDITVDYENNNRKVTIYRVSR